MHHIEKEAIVVFGMGQFESVFHVCKIDHFHFFAVVVGVAHLLSQVEHAKPQKAAVAEKRVDLALPVVLLFARGADSQQGQWLIGFFVEDEAGTAVIIA